MHVGRKVTFFALVAAALLPAQAVRADDLKSVLKKLDAAAQGFQTTSAHVEFDTIQTDPVPDKDVMTGTAYYERRDDRFEMAAHITEEITEGKNHPTAKTYIFSNGVFRLSETGKEKDAKPYPQATKYESYLMLGFGASGRDLEKKWTIKYLGTETIDGVTTDKLELVAKDPDIRKNLPKVTVWMDTARAVSLKQVYDEADGTSRVCYYTNIKVNQPLPKGAFSFDTSK